MKHDRNPILYRVFKAYGTASALAKALGVSKQTISVWGKIPARHIMQIAHETGIAPQELRPDIYILVKDKQNEQDGNNIGASTERKPIVEDLQSRRNV